MERVRELIDKLWRQHQQQEGPGQLLDTVHHLQEELVRMVRKEQPASAGKVAVVLPPKRRVTTVSVSAPPQPLPPEAPEAKALVPQPPDLEPVAETPAIAPEPVIPSRPIPDADVPYLPQVQATAEPQPEAATAPLPPQQETESPARAPYFLQKPVVSEQIPPAAAAAAEPVATPSLPAVPQKPATPAEPEREVFHLHFDTTDEAPTLTQQFAQQPRELHELIGENKESLNDRLKQDRPDLVHKLKDTPIKDLRKAIGVNDKFLFIKELFRGDEAMYERSIKTINGFHILPEAEYWISRELKVKLGWDDSSEAVQSFYQLVRRRFA